MRKFLFLALILICIPVLLVFKSSHKLEHIVRNSGFEYDNAGNYSEYVGYKYNFETNNSKYCGVKKSASFYTRVKSYVGNKMYYYCDNGNNEVYEFEYDFDERELKPVADSSVFSTELNLSEEEKEKYSEIYNAEFSAFNSDLLEKWDD